MADNLVPDGTVLCEEVSIATATGGDPTTYPTALIPTSINDRTVMLYAAIVPADNMPFPVIMGRFIPGTRVTWNLRVETEEGEVINLEQTTNVPDAKPPEKTSRRKNKFRWMQQQVEAGKAKVIENGVEKRAEKKVVDPVEMAAGEPSSQVLEESADAVPLSPTDKEMTRSDAEMLDLTEVPVAAVTTRAQSKKAVEQLLADQLATEGSGVALTPPSEPERAASACEAKKNDFEEAEESEEEFVITRQELIELQQQDESLAEMFLAAEDPDSLFEVRGGILYTKKLSTQEESAVEEKEAQVSIVVPEKLRKKVIEAGHDQAGHMGTKKTRRMIGDQFYWPGMASQIAQYCKACPVCLEYNFKKTTKEPLHPLPVIS